ncbi:MAG: tetratricopeptide repeat protein, partial [Planctomycetota bacterium]
MATRVLRPEQQVSGEQKWREANVIAERDEAAFPESGDRGRRRSLVWRAVIIVALTIVLLLCWQGVAYTLSPDRSNPTQAGGGSATGGAQPAEAAKGKTPARRPLPPLPPAGDDSLESRILRYLEQEARTKGESAGAKVSSGERIAGAAAPGNEDGKPRAQGGEDPPTGETPPAGDGKGGPAGSPRPSASAGAAATPGSRARAPAQAAHAPLPASRPSPAAGRALAPAPIGEEIPPLGAIPDEEIRWTETIELALSLERELAGHGGAADPRTLRQEIYHRLIDLSIQVGATDNPRSNLEAIRELLLRGIAIRVVESEASEPALLLPSGVLLERRASPLGTALLALAFADRLSPYLSLEPVLAGDLIGLRYRSGHHRFILIPSRLDRLYTDREMAEVAFGDALTTGAEIRALTRRQFWGLVLGEAGRLIHAVGEPERAALLIDRGLALYGEQARARLARARILIERRELERAREELDIALELDPGSPAARLERVGILEALGEREAAKKDLVWLAREGKLPLASLRLGRLLLEEGRFQEAMEEVKRLEGRELAPAMEEETSRLRLQVEAAPW